MLFSSHTDPPFSVIRYNLISSISSQILLADFLHGSIAPNFICSSDGRPDPQISWQKAGGFPNGVEIKSDGSELVWGRRLEYTDSGQYECVSENILEINDVILKLTVQSESNVL